MYQFRQHIFFQNSSDQSLVPAPAGLWWNEQETLLSFKPFEAVAEMLMTCDVWNQYEQRYVDPDTLEVKKKKL